MSDRTPITASGPEAGQPASDPPREIVATVATEPRETVATAPPETIALDGITLRRWDPAWAEDLQDAVQRSLPELGRFMPWATEGHGLKESRDYIDRTVAEWVRGEAWGYAILADGQRVVGSIGLMTRMGPGVLEIGYWVHSDYAGRGYASAAASALAEVALTMRGVDRAAIKHDVANVASGRVAAKAGFRHTGEESAEAIATDQTGTEWIWERP